MPTEIIVFAKAAEPGRVKTRLAATVGDQQATDIYITLLDKALGTAVRAAENLSGHASIYYDGPLEHPEFVRLRNRYPALSFHPQVSGDLGQRMHAALSSSLETHDVAVIIGADCPALTPAIIEQAANQCAAPCHHCFVPATDGGYVLIASSKSDKAVFDGIEWGTETVMRRTAEQLDRNNLSWSKLTALSDVDTWADYKTQQHLL